MRLTLSLVLLLVVAGLGGLALSERAYQQRSERLESDIAAYRQLRWRRAPLRGAARPGNAAQQAHRALAALPRVPRAVLSSMVDQLHYGQPLGEAHHALLKRHDATLRELVDSTQCGWSMTVLPVEQGLDMPVPDYQRAVEGAALALAQGVAEGPEVCLRRAADVARLGQDLVPGAPLQAASAATRMNALVVRVVRSCAPLAGGTALKAAAREFARMAKAPPPTGHGLLLRDLATAASLRNAGRLPPSPSHYALIATARTRPDIFAAWDFLSDPHRFAQWSPERYPNTLSSWRSEARRRVESGLPQVAAASDGVNGFIHDDMRGQALLRATAVALAVLVERQVGGRTPARPAARWDPDLSDPFTGRPLGYTAREGEISLWSVGEDLRNGEGDSAWSERAPLDVVAHLTLPRDRSGRSGSRTQRKRRKR